MKKLFSIVLAACLLFSNSANALRVADHRYMEDVTYLTNCKAMVNAIKALKYTQWTSTAGSELGFYGHELRDAISVGSPPAPLSDSLVFGTYVNAPRDEINDVDILFIETEQLIPILACAQKEAYAELSTHEDAIDGMTTAMGSKADKSTTVNGHALSANVTITKGDVGLGNVDNTSDANKPVSTAQAASIATKANATHTHSASDLTSGTLPDARVAQSNVTQHQAALSIASTQVTGTKTDSYISNFAAAARAAISVTGNGSYNSGTGVITINSSPSRVFNNNVSRTLNTAYTISSTRDARASYSVNVAWTIQALLSGSSSAFLEYSTDSGTTWITVNQVSKNIGLLTFAGNDDLNLVGEIPAGASTRIRTTSTNMAVSYVRGQEVLQ